ncbi:Wzz/FepE/Etk N-terminal domain-containing protein [Nonomuraea rubra]|uniref:Capsular polysaccharide biosynthesis protein n=1 Tax=Nonomuraea rubra TaxID=46180 RepID=A0A7X0TW61_9ACTN|nr:Wzz/FepE/Etk N-terminal domain-containing protein [Nonomuraea rubra]MBB6545998.1 capsular polysaccharide biosynthesis protein [Nonomuraea rubra]
MSSGTDLDEHLSLLRRRWLLLVGCVVFGGTAGLALLRLTPPAYTATTQVLVMPVGPQEQANQVTSRQRESLNLDTEAQVAQSAVVAARAARALGLDRTEPVEVTVPPNSAVLWISVTAADAATAAAQAGAYAEAYLANRRESALTSMAEQQEAVLSKLRQVNAAMDQVIKQLDGLPRGGPEHAIATQRQGVLNRQAASLALKYDALRTVAITPGTVISQAAPPEAPSSPSLPLHLGTGLMAGLLIGSAAAYLRDRLDRRLRTPADVERLTGLPLLSDLSSPREHGALHDLACAVVSACPGKRLLIKALPADLYASSLAEPLAVSAPLVVLDGSDVRDLARADAAVLLVGLGLVSAEEVAATVRQLGRHDVPVIGVVTTTDAVPSFVPLLEPRSHGPHGPHSSLGKLVATGELEPGVSAETTPMQALHHHPRRPGKQS